MVRCFRSLPAHWILPSANSPSRGFCWFASVTASVRQHRSPTDNHAPVPVHAGFSLPFTGGYRFSKGFCAAASVTSARALSSCSVIDPLPPFLAHYPDIFHWSRWDRSICASHMRHQRSGRGILQLCGRNVPVARPAAFAISRIVG